MFSQTHLQFGLIIHVSAGDGGKLLPRKVAMMADLRLETSEGEYLLLSMPTGETHRLVIDDALRRAVRREVISTDDSNIISPREIQLEVRAGLSIEDIVSKTGASAEYVTKFAAPVIDELAHVVKSALSVRITMAGDRYSETTQVEFGEVITNRLAAQGVVSYSWSARKSDNGGWQLHCKYNDGQATWAFDARKLALSPENELAVGLSTQQSLTDGPIPRLRSVVDTVSSESAGGTATLTAPAPVTTSTPVATSTPASQFAAPTSASAPISEAATEAIATVPVEDTTVAAEAPEKPKATVTPIWEQPVEPSELSKPRQTAPVERIAPVTAITADLGKTVEFDGVVPFGRASGDLSENESGAGENLANTADLLDALRRRRLEREQEVLNTNTGAIDLVDLSQLSGTEELDGIDEPAPDTTPISVTSSEVTDDPAGAEDFIPESAEPEKPKKPARPSMPSWDEIVFNTRNDD